MKKNKNCFPALLLLVIIVFPACGPGLKKGEKIQIGKDEAAGYWKLENVDVSHDTLILVNSEAKMVSRFKAKNFVFSADLLTTPGAEAMIRFHASDGETVTNRGYSVMINNSDYRSGNAQKTGSLSLIRNNFVRTARDDAWFNLKIEVRSNHILVSVDDKIVSEYIQPEQPLRKEGLENMVLSDGSLIFQKSGESGQIRVGNIYLELLDDNLTAEVDTVFQNDSTGKMLTLLNQEGFPLIDFHGHLKGGLTMEQICRHGRLNGYNYGIAPNCGLNFPVTNDSSLLAYYDEISREPVFKAMQCEGREWITLFSPGAIAKYDYIFTDAMTWTDHKGRRMRLWIPEETFVGDEQKFMEMLLGKIEAVISQEPVDIHVNPTFLPESIAAHYDQLWTPERMDRVIKVLVDNDVALEINSRFKIPSLAFVKRAKAAGVKFTLGTNNGGNTDLGRLEYSLQIVKEAGLSASDMFLPRPSGDKKVMKKGLPAKITG